MLFESTHSDFNLLFKTKLSQMLSPDELRRIYSGFI